MPLEEAFMRFLIGVNYVDEAYEKSARSKASVLSLKGWMLPMLDDIIVQKLFGQPT